MVLKWWFRSITHRVLIRVRFWRVYPRTVMTLMILMISVMSVMVGRGGTVIAGRRRHVYHLVGDFSFEDTTDVRQRGSSRKFCVHLRRVHRQGPQIVRVVLHRHEHAPHILETHVEMDGLHDIDTKALCLVVIHDCRHFIEQQHTSVRDGCGVGKVGEHVRMDGCLQTGCWIDQSHRGVTADPLHVGHQHGQHRQACTSL